MAKSPITCHVLDSSLGKPAEGISIRLQEFSPAKYEGGPDIFDPLAKGVTNADGRCLDLLTPKEDSEEGPIKLTAGRTYKIIFRVQEYFESTNRKCFYPWVERKLSAATPKQFTSDASE
ncbi:hypothetical protein HGRIS_008254 [Hohenbuehelia grisea]|uniref:Transthyretin/hydroxyisourate hydrolase domain-containing protein n=1 Tax=Hohenbuehelia grisea TaxID=104357 RepID=A0ABR3J7U9_9AGAR